MVAIAKLLKEVEEFLFDQFEKPNRERRHGPLGGDKLLAFERARELRDNINSVLKEAMSELLQRLRVVKALLSLAWMALWTNSAVFSLVYFTSVSDERDSLNEVLEARLANQ